MTKEKKGKKRMEKELTTRIEVAAAFAAVAALYLLNWLAGNLP